MNNVFQISQLAKTNRPRAEAALLEFVENNFPQVKALSVKIKESKLSLNSVNGIIQGADGQYFYKFHAEENEGATENLEYYNAKLLRDQGLPMIMPLYAKTDPGSQFLIYPYMDYPTAFDEYEKEEARFLETGSYNERRLEELLKAESGMLEKILKAYVSSLALSNTQAVKDASLHQLFYRRLVSPQETKPRLNLFYANKPVKLPAGKTLNFDQLANLSWIINGVSYNESLNEIIEKAKILLDPQKELIIPTVIGHGDDHNGNKFFTGNRFAFFDPAFAGRQPALLSFIKATAHNTLLHPFWLYDPARLQNRLKISFEIQDNTIKVEHNWNLEQLSPLRLQILNLYAKELWQPLVSELKQKNWLPSDWKEYMRKALFCCPFLVTNLIDYEKYSPEQSILALSKCIELGSKADKNTLVSNFINSLNI